MRQVLNDDARDILKRAVKELFDTQFGFDVQFLQGENPYIFFIRFVPFETFLSS